ncbi:Gfo/Idh/MocA family protein [Nocardiopsis aegyptia]|uniref:Inositol 2-dehydrogenase n=1 Tax=Nocardiopsis aegyptia TaxID=220378 RepID=A0A7Z0JA45_9ACTN|nr:Gfo/Idh/MocA family oxidoreductase [Nocardiopsis aegyptia]NYJ34397.1 myo-inositol 2-dehydrogenase/D-chiro-inositol 1-dehydrogenase [Nocardiopsis aegyptia]
MTVRVGVIGTGWIGGEHIRRITDRVGGAEVVAVTDIDADRAARAVAGTGARVLATGEEVIAAEDVDAVVVTSWGPAHAESVLAAVAAGKPVFCEKPLATSAEDAQRILDAEARHGARLVQVGFMRRYDTGYRQMKEVVSAGGIGTPLMAHCVHRNPTVPESYHSEMASQDTAVHEIDVLRWLLDDEISSVQVLTPRPTGKRFEHLRDPQMLLFEMVGGARVDLEVFVNCQYGYEIGCEVVGEEGTVRLPEVPGAVVRSAARTSTPVLQDWVQRFAGAFDAEFQSWADEVAAGTPTTGPNAWDGYAAAVVTDAAVRALHSGGVVETGIKERPAFYA